MVAHLDLEYLDNQSRKINWVQWFYTSLDNIEKHLSEKWESSLFDYLSLFLDQFLKE